MTVNDAGVKHAHYYERVKTRGHNRIYRCMDPDCHHYIRATLLKGKRVVCSLCRIETLIITGEDLKRKHFRCLNCSNTQEAITARNQKALVSDKMEEVFSKFTKYDPIEP